MKRLNKNKALTEIELLREMIAVTLPVFRPADIICSEDKVFFAEVEEVAKKAYNMAVEAIAEKFGDFPFEMRSEDILKMKI